MQIFTDGSNTASYFLGYLSNSPKCSSCGEVFPIPLTHRELGKYEEYLFNQNLHIHNIFPEMKPEIRELLSKEPGPHLCAKCRENQMKSGGEC